MFSLRFYKLLGWNRLNIVYNEGAELLGDNFVEEWK